MSSNEIMQFSYFYWKTNEKTADKKMMTMESAMTAILRDVSGKMYSWNTIRSSSGSGQHYGRNMKRLVDSKTTIESEKKKGEHVQRL